MLRKRRSISSSDKENRAFRRTSTCFFLTSVAAILEYAINEGISGVVELVKGGSSDKTSFVIGGKEVFSNDGDSAKLNAVTTVGNAVTVGGLDRNAFTLGQFKFVWP